MQLARNSRGNSDIMSRSLKTEICPGGGSLPPKMALSFTLAQIEDMSIHENEASTNEPCKSIVNGSLSPPILSHIGECSPPGTLTKDPHEENNIISCRNWCSSYSQVCYDHFTICEVGQHVTLANLGRGLTIVGLGIGSYHLTDS